MPSEQEKKMDKLKKAYLKDPTKCPVCKSDNIAAKGLDVDGSVAVGRVECLECGERWKDIYTLTDIEGDD